MNHCYEGSNDLPCKACEHYWRDVKWCPLKEIFLPEKLCSDFKEVVEDIENVSENRRDCV